MERKTFSGAISVIIPTKNRLADLSETVEAVLVQTRLPNELFVVDQSTEDTSDTHLYLWLPSSRDSLGNTPLR